MRLFAFCFFTTFFQLFGVGQSSVTIAICQCASTEMMEIIQIAKFYGYKFDDRLMRETGISDYSSSVNKKSPATSTINISPILAIVNHNRGQNKKIILSSNLEKIEKDFETYNREYYSKDKFLDLIICD